MPPSLLPARRVRLAPRPTFDDDTQPVLRLRQRGAMREEEQPATVG